MLAKAAIAAAGALNGSFPLFCPETCLSGHDNIVGTKDLSQYMGDDAISAHYAASDLEFGMGLFTK